MSKESDIKKQALKELEEEQFKEAVQKHKEKLKARKRFWKSLFPWKITITKKDLD